MLYQRHHGMVVWSIFRQLYAASPRWFESFLLHCNIRAFLTVVEISAVPGLKEFKKKRDPLPGHIYDIGGHIYDIGGHIYDIGGHIYEITGHIYTLI